MLFNSQEKIQILYQLEVPLSQKTQLETALATMEEKLAQEDEDAQVSYKQRVNDLIAQLEAARETKTQSATEDAGMIRLDVIEYSENKDHKIDCHKDQLRYRLARLIGYELIYYAENSF